MGKVIVLFGRGAPATGDELVSLAVFDSDTSQDELDVSINEWKARGWPEVRSVALKFDEEQVHKHFDAFDVPATIPFPEAT